MLHQLTIRNFAIIDHLQIEWQPGLNVITGETGAGKSIIIDAVGALLGDRLGPEVVRSGADRALVEGIFVVETPTDPQLQSVLDEYGLEPEDGALIVSRELAGSGGGRGGARVNGRGVPLAVLQELGERLVDVHGQSQHMALLRVREQLDYLDRFGGALAGRAQVAELGRDLRSTRETRQRLLAEEREAARMHDVLRHETAEIDSADLRPGEEDALNAQRTRLEHVERLRQSAQTAYAALSGSENSASDLPAAIDLLGRATAAIAEAARFDDALQTEADNLNAALVQAEESAHTVRDYIDSLEADPEALQGTAERLFRIADLKRKYGETVDDVLAYADQARAKLDELEHRAERADELLAAEEHLLEALGAAAARLSDQRASAARDLSAAVERELADLRLGSARFCVAIEHVDDSSGVPVDGRYLAFDATGVDHVEFKIDASGQDEPRSMARVASGGELARIALALKTILARAETRPTLIFDEIDMGVGGRTAPVVGEKLWSVASAGRQVLCITHMAQVAAYADAHFAVTRADGATAIARLDEPARRDELAAMLGGVVTDTTRKSARELLSRAQATKRR